MPRIESGQNPATGLGGLDSLKAAKMVEINAAFVEAEKTGHVLSKLGFEIDATERAIRDVDGLITKLTATGANEAHYCDYENKMQAVTLDQLKTIQLEIIDFGQALYGKKWTLREMVNATESPEEIAAVQW